MELIDKIKTLTKALLDTREEFTAYITNKEIPLDERWEVWLSAPILLKNNKPYIQHFDVEKKVGKFFWFDDFYKDRYAVVEMSDIIEMIEEDFENIDENEKSKWTQELIDEFKEEILEKNLYSFVNDW